MADGADWDRQRGEQATHSVGMAGMLRRATKHEEKQQLQWACVFCVFGTGFKE